jgi:hypothetical protein
MSMSGREVTLYIKGIVEEHGVEWGRHCLSHTLFSALCIEQCLRGCVVTRQQH